MPIQTKLSDLRDLTSMYPDPPKNICFLEVLKNKASKKHLVGRVLKHPKWLSLGASQGAGAELRALRRPVVCSEAATAAVSGAVVRFRGARVKHAEPGRQLKPLQKTTS